MLEPRQETKGITTWRDVVMAGMSPKYAVRRIKSLKPHPSRHAMLRAVTWLNDNGHLPQAKAIVRYVEQNFPLTQRSTGRVKPQPGDVRHYSVQAQKSGLFLRTPVELLADKQGEDLMVEFHPSIMPGVLLIRKPTESERRTIARERERRSNVEKEEADEQEPG